MVIIDGMILGKPKDEADAIEMLKALRDRSQTVVTGVTLTDSIHRHTFSVSTDVRFAAISDDEIQYYVEKYRPLDKAGAYGIQEWIGAIGIESISGSFYNVMGLPVHRLYNELKTSLILYNLDHIYNSHPDNIHVQNIILNCRSGVANNRATPLLQFYSYV